MNKFELERYHVLAAAERDRAILNHSEIDFVVASIKVELANWVKELYDYEFEEKQIFTYLSELRSTVDDIVIILGGSYGTY